MMKNMKKLFTILMMLLATVSIYAETETTLWEDTYSDGIELKSTTVATFKAGDILRVYATVPEGGANFKICYKGESNSWAETTIPSIDTQWPWINGGETYYDVTFTEADITALSGMNIYIYKGENSTISKVTLITASSGNDEFTPGENETVLSVADGSESLPLVLGTGSDWGKYTTFSASSFTAAKAGDIITVYVKDVNSGAQISLKDMSNGWPALEESTQYPSVETTATTYTYTLTETTVAKVKSDGLVVGGHDLTVVRVTLTSVPVSTTQYTLTVKQPTDGTGTIQIDNADAEASKAYNEGTVLSLSAVPITNYQLNTWTSTTYGVVTDENKSKSPLSITMTKDIDISATFSVVNAKILDWKHEYETGALSTAAVGDKVRITFAKTDVDTEGMNLKVFTKTASWDYNAAIYDDAITETTYDVEVTNDNQADISARGLFIQGNNITLQSVEVIKSYTVTVSSVTGGTISVKNGNTSLVEGENTIYSGTTLSLEATPDGTHSFSNWKIGDDTSITTNPHDYTVTGAVTIGAMFTENSIPAFSLDGFATYDPGSEKNTPTYNTDTHVLTTTSDWTGIQLYIGDNSTYSGSKLVVKTNEECKIRVMAYYVGEGTVENSYETASKDHVVNLDSNKKIQKVFIDNTETGTVTFTEFALDPTYTLTKSATTNGSFTVSADGGTSTTDETSFAYGTTLTFTATADPNFVFSKWSDEATENPHNVVITDDLTIGATFEVAKTENDLNATATAMGSWTGFVTIAKEKFANASVNDVLKIYVQDVEDGAQISLKDQSESWPALEEATQYASLTGTVFPYTISTEEILTKLKTYGLVIGGQKYTYVKATLTTTGEVPEMVQYTLAVTAENGTVAKSPLGTDNKFDAGTQVTLTASPNEGYTFSKWTIGETENTDNPLTYTINSDVTITAVFEENVPATPVFDENGKADLSKFSADAATYTYADGKGTLACTEAWKGISVSLPSDEYFQATKLIVKFAESTPAYVHASYEGETEWKSGNTYDKSGTGTELVLPLDHSKKVTTIHIQLTEANTTAVLTEVSISNMCTLTTSVANGTITVIKGDDTEATDNREFEYGTKLKLTATVSGSDYAFKQWTSGESVISTENPYTFTITSDTTLTAEFKSADADVIWLGSQVINWNTGSSQTITVTTEDNLKIADQLVFTIEPSVEGLEWPQLQLSSKSDGTPVLIGTANTAIDANTTEVRYYVTKAMLNNITENGGFIVSGSVFTLKKVKIERYTGSEDYSKAIWIGEKVYPSGWSVYTTIGKDIFANATAGQVIRMKYKDVKTGSAMNFSYDNNGWNTLPDTETVTPSGLATKLTITEDMLTALKAGGLIISGVNFTLTSVELLDASDVKTLTGTVPVTGDDWVWTSSETPSFTVNVSNENNEAVTAEAVMLIKTDKLADVTTLNESKEIAANGSETITFTYKPESAGFYNATVIVNDETVRSFNFGYAPTEIVSVADKQSDFDTFWQTAKSQLDAIDINATLTEITSKSGTKRKVYLVEMQSVPDGTSGDPVTIRGYYAEPTDGKKHPVIVTFQGYDSEYRPAGQDATPYCMDGDNSESDYAEFILSTRGQCVNNRTASERVADGKGDFTNIYGDWFAYKFGDKDKYYYRGAYMDCVRAIQFMASRPTSDMDNLFAQGQSQGGAFTYAAAALSGYTFKAIAPAITFMGDFPDYFELASWPASVAKANQGTMTDAEMYAFLSYFDTKNLAAKVNCPIITSIGVQDNVCPPHTNIAPYNNTTTAADKKQIVYNAELQHATNSDWFTTYMNFFNTYKTASDARTEKELLADAAIECGSSDEGNAETIPGYKFSKAEAGDKLIVHVSNVGSDAYISLKSPKTYNSLLDDYSTSVATSDTELSLYLTDDLIGKLIDNGLAIYAKNLTIGQVTLYTENEIGTETDAKYTLTVEATHGIVTVSPASDNNRYARDTELTITVTSVDSGYEFLYWQKNGADLTETSETLTINMDGTAMTITAVIAEKDIDETAVWKGDKEIGYFDTYVNGAEKQYLADVSQYDTIYVYTKDILSSAKYELQYKDGDGWNVYTTLQKDDAAVPEIIKYCVTDAAIAKLIADRGLVIKGEGFHVKKISLHKLEYNLINAKATTETKALFDQLKQNYGSKIYAATVANVDWNIDEAASVFSWTGKYPAMNVFDFTNIHASKDVNPDGWIDYSDDSCVTSWSKAGGIVGAMWHWQVLANNDTDYTCTPGTENKQTSFDASQILVEGTAENTLAKNQLDQICGYLTKLQTAGIPVIWRPLHEAAGNTYEYADGKAWFWWGAKGAEVYKNLWRWMYDYMVNTKGLNNLIWVWTSQTKDGDWYPGDNYVDIIGRDSYGATAASLASDFKTLSQAYPNKMITLSECGNTESASMAPLSDMWNAGAHWSWFMTWYNGDSGTHSTEAWWTAAMGQDYVINGGSDGPTLEKLEVEEKRTLWTGSADFTPYTQQWGKQGAQSANVGGILEEGEKVFLTIASIAKDSTDIQVLLRSADYEHTLGFSKFDDFNSYPAEVKLILSADDVAAFKNGFHITGKNCTVTKMVLYKPTPVNRTERTLLEQTQAVGEGIAINRGLFSNAAEEDVLKVYFEVADGVTAKINLEDMNYNGIENSWPVITTSPYTYIFTAKALEKIQSSGLRIRGENFTFRKATLYTEKELGTPIEDGGGDGGSDDGGGGDDGGDDNPQPTPDSVIDSTTGEVATEVFQAMGDNATFDAETGVMTTTEPWAGVQAWFNEPESVPESANVLVVNIEETNIVVQVTVGYTDGTESQATSTVGGSVRRRAHRAGSSGIDIIVPVDPEKEIQKIMIQAAEPGTITINSITARTQPLFTDGRVDLSMLKAQGGKVTYDTSTHTMATTAGWTGVTMTVTSGETVKGVELYIRTTNPATMKMAVEYADGTQRDSIMADAASIVKMQLDATKLVKTIYIQPTAAAIIQFQEISVNATHTPDIVNPVFTNGKADLSRLVVQDADRVMYNAETHKMVTTDGWIGVQLTPDKGEKVSGAELMVKFAEPVTMKLAVVFSDGSQCDTIMSEASTELKLALDNTLEIAQIQLQPTSAAVVEFLEIAVNQEVTPDPEPEPLVPVFGKDGKADLSRIEVQDANRVMYNKTSHKLATTDGWVGVQLSTVEGEKVSGAELMVKFAEPAVMKLVVAYSDGSQCDTIMSEASTELKLPLDNTLEIAQIQLQPTSATVVELLEIAVNQERTPDPEPEPVVPMFGKDGKADLSRLEVQDADRVMYNTETHKMATTDGWVGVQLSTVEGETATGAEIALQFAQPVTVKLAVTYTDETQTDTIMSQADTLLIMPLDIKKPIAQVQIQPTSAGVVEFLEIALHQELTPIPEPVIVRLFDAKGQGNLSVFEPMSNNAKYDQKTHVLTTTENWAGVQVWLDEPQTVKGNTISVRFAEENANARIVVGYTDGSESAGDAGTANATETGTEIFIAHDSSKEIQKMMIQMPVAGKLTLTGISSISYSVSPLDVTEKRLLWKNDSGETLSWNDIAKKGADYGSILEAGEMILVTVKSLVDGNDWPKLFLRDAQSEMVGEEMLLNGIRNFPYQARFTLDAEMKAQMADGFSLCGDGVVVTRVELYKPEPPKEGDINLVDLNGGWNSTYDAATHTITTTARWAARGWDIGDARYNDMDVIIVRFEPVAFPVTLKMEYTDAEGRRQATSDGVAAGNTAAEISIPRGLQTIDKVYLVLQNPGSVTLTAAEVLSTGSEQIKFDLGSFEAMGDNVTYDNVSYTMTSADAWVGIQLWLGGNTIEGGQLIRLTCADETAKVRLSVGYTDGTETSVDAEGSVVELELDDLRSIQKVAIQNQEAGTLALKDITITARTIDEVVLARQKARRASTDDSLYSIDGSKVNAPNGGLYIQNGKKVVVK